MIIDDEEFLTLLEQFYEAAIEHGRSGDNHAEVKVLRSEILTMLDIDE